MATKARSGKRATTGGRKRATGARRGGGGARRASTKTSTRRSTTAKRATTRGRTAASATRRKSREFDTPEGVATTDHNLIRRWVEERGGQPACVRGTGDSGDVGLLRIDFPGYTGAESLQPISWNEFFKKFDERKLAFLHQRQTQDGGRSYFNKLIDRPKASGADRRGHGRRSS